MKKIYESKNIVLEVELSKNISFNNIFGKLKFIINGKNIANDNENNLSYLYVDFESLKLLLEKNIKVENELFQRTNKEILFIWNEWENYNLNFDLTNEEDYNVKFFDRNYFKTSNIFNSFFFDDIMIFYIIEDNFLKFKYWYKLDGNIIYEANLNKEELINTINSFLSFFNSTNNYFKDKL